MRSRVAFLLVLMLLTSSFGALAACAGWEGSAADRMACCEHHQDGCDTQLAADRCCGGGEQAQQPSAQASLAAFDAAPIALLPRLLYAPAAPLFGLPATGAMRSDTLPVSPPHLLDTVLLI